MLKFHCFAAPFAPGAGFDLRPALGRRGAVAGTSAAAELVFGTRVANIKETCGRSGSSNYPGTKLSSSSEETSVLSTIEERHGEAHWHWVTLPLERSGR
jgi:hypothetical protein